MSQSYWHPLSTVLLSEPRCYASPSLVGMLLRTGAPVEVIYAGDKMWPTLPHASTVRLSRLDGDPRPGQIVLACPDDVPDLLRIDSVTADGLHLGADSDPEIDITVSRKEILALAAGSGPAPARWARRMRRQYLDLREAWTARNDTATDPADTVLDKYDHQAPFYARAQGHEIDPALLSHIEEQIARPGRILVVGSGSGRESFALSRAGWQVAGVDFSPAMVEQATAEAARQGLDARFELGDIRTYDVEPASLVGVVMTYDVYSFLPSASRVETLRRMREWLAPGGTIFLSARLARSPYSKAILSVQWLAHGRAGKHACWGDSHTRWISSDGHLHRSFIHLFTPRGLAEEIARAGFTAGRRTGGHVVLTPRPLL